MKRLIVFGIFLLVALPGRADIDAKIVDYPTRVLRYSPILVTVKVENQSRSGLLIPATNFTASSYFIETGSTSETLTEFQPIQSTGGGSVRWLEPGGIWLFQVDLGPWYVEPSRLFVAAGIKSTGECQYHSTGTEKFPLKVLRKTPGNESYQCWSGRVESSVVSIEIVEPTAAIDQQALEYVQSPGFPVSESRLNYRMRFGFNHLLERFPTSHYTYAAGFYECRTVPSCLQHLMDLQPSHPLTPHMRLQRALALFSSAKDSEATTSVEGPGLPDGLEQYLLQQKQEARVTLGAANGRR